MIDFIIIILISTALVFAVFAAACFLAVAHLYRNPTEILLACWRDHCESKTKPAKTEHKRIDILV